MMFLWLKKFFSGTGDKPVPPPTSDEPLEEETNVAPKGIPRAATNPPPRAAQAAPIIIGLDFGTSSTKVVFRRLGERVSWVIPSFEVGTGMAWFCFPTIKEDGKPIKLHLLDVSSRNGDYGEIEKQAVAYLGAILEHAAGQVRQHYGIKAFRPIVNIGVPVAYFGSLEERKAQFRKYEAVAQAALAASTMGGGRGLKRGQSQEERNEVVEKGIRTCRGLKDCVAVLPESVAALISLSQEPTVEPGIYTVVDIGAGTTEMSTSLFYVSGDGRKVSCYQDCTERIGILEYSDFDESGDAEQKRTFLNSWWRQFEVNWEQARRKDAGSRCALRVWENTVVMFTGGGGFHPDIQEFFKARIKTDQDWCHVMKPRNYQPSLLALKPIRGKESASRDGFHLLAVAHGLSFHRREWPDWYKPDEVEPIEALEQSSMPFDPQEAGYED